LTRALEDLERAYEQYRYDPVFLTELELLQHDFAGRPTALFLAERPSQVAGCLVYLKREDLAHTGAHKINNTLVKELGRVEYTSATDEQALSAFNGLARLEGIIPALESAHALAYLFSPGHGFAGSDVVVACLSGRGDKDVHTVARALGMES
jgi:tryptophan synthase beta subunit